MDTKNFDYSKNAVLKKNVKNWYQLHHIDKLSNHINSDLTFQDVANCLLFGCDVYNCIGICDSVIREIIFSELSEILGKDYDFVYNLWLKSENK